MSVTVNNYEDNLADYPAVTICNINPFDSNVATTKTFLDAQLVANGLKPKIVATETSPAIYQVRQAMRVLKASALATSLTNSTFTKSLGFTIDSLLISCYFNGAKCNSSDFTIFYSFDYGNCYTFNKNTGSTLRSTSKSGPSSGLSLEIFTGYPGKLPGL